MLFVGQPGAAWHLDMQEYNNTPDSTETPPTEADHDARTPVNLVRFSDSGRQFIIDDCVICGETHRHGSMDPTVANGGRSHRVEHCYGVNHSGGYYLELADDAEPPEWWHSWIDEQSEIEVEA